MATRAQSSPKRRSQSWLLRRSVSNLLRMGHCAPTVTRTLLDALAVRSADLVRAAGGLPGGIGNTGEECGGITGVLMGLGLRHARDPLVDGLPPIVYMGHDYMRRFAACHGSLRCADILRPKGLSLPCINVIMRSPGRWQATTCHNCVDAITAERREAFRSLHAHLSDARFHCAHAVLEQLCDCVPVADELLDASAGFVGGTVFSGRTCSALTAGVLALGAARGGIENSRLRVARMIGLMAMNGDALADHVNVFNATVSMGNRLARWFTERFGSTLCATLTDCDFTTVGGVQRYIDGGGAARCRQLASDVAVEVRRVIGSDSEEAASGPSAPGATSITSPPR